MRKSIILLIAVAFTATMALTLSTLNNTAKAEQNPSTTFMAGDFDLDASISAGKLIYEGKGTCSVCHQATGLGMPPAFPPLAKADYLLEDVQRAVKQTMYGSKTPITVNGTTYNGGMMTVAVLTDEEVRDVVNYILNSWGNEVGSVTVDDVKAARE